ncbi:MAG: hypothetical protein ACKO3K_00530, partial [Cuspidothrix sp.]
PFLPALGRRMFFLYALVHESKLDFPPVLSPQGLPFLLYTHLCVHRSLVGQGLGERSILETEFITHLTKRSENNFMYVSQILAAINNGFYHQYS